MQAQTVRISKNLIYLEGREPRFGLVEPDVAASLVYKLKDVVYLFDTGCGKGFRGEILRAVESLRPFRALKILNSHSHPDHTANNSLLLEIQAGEKRHYISESGIRALDYLEDFGAIGLSLKPWCDMLDIAGFPWSMFLAPWKAWEKIHPRGRRHFLRSTLSKFRPLEPSPNTAQAVESLPALPEGTLNHSGTGYNLDDAVWIFPSGGHSPDHCVFFLPEEGLLHTGDETFSVFPLWPNSDSRRIMENLNWFRELNAEGRIRIHLDAHNTGIRYGGEALDSFFSGLSETHRDFKAGVEAVLKDASDAGVEKIYRSLKSGPRTPGVAKYFSQEFPRMPVYLKIVIAGIIMELQAEALKERI